MTGTKQSTVAKILSYQLLLILLTSLLFAYWGWQKSYSSALGGVIAFIPNMYFALRISSSAKREAKIILRSFYIGEAVKLLLTAALFIIMIKLPKVEILPLLTGYMIALSVFWFALLMR